MNTPPLPTPWHGQNHPVPPRPARRPFFCSAVRKLWLLGLICRVISTQAQTLPLNPYKAPLYWSVYEYLLTRQEEGVGNIYIPESELSSNIDFVVTNLKSAGYTMICLDGWGDTVKLSPNGYQASHCRNWAHDFGWWSTNLQQRGLSLGIYANPLWIHVNPSDVSTLIAGTNLPVSSLINPSENASFQWCQVERPGAEQYVKGCVAYYAGLGVKYLRVDFLSWYESGWDRYAGQVGPTNRPHADYVTALKWMREAADTNGMFLSLVMPNLFTVSNMEAQVERQYGHMIRVDEDCGDGQWWQWSDNTRGIKRLGWSAYANGFDGLTYWSYIGGRSNLILDPDFLRINSFANNEEKKSAVSACLVAGGAVTPTDRYCTIGNDVWVYLNPEMLALRTDGFVGAPRTNDPTLPTSQVWSGQMTGGDWVVGLFNRESTVQTRSLAFSQLGLAAANVRDLWGHTNLGRMSAFSASLPAHGCCVLRLSTNSLNGPVPLHVQSLTTGTRTAPSGGSLGTATVVLLDAAGNPVSGASVFVTFSGSFAETVSGITDAAGSATLVTTVAAAGNIKVTADVMQVTHPTEVYAADQNAITSTGVRMFAPGTFNHWQAKDNPMLWVSNSWKASSLTLFAGTNYQMKFANTVDWSGDDWGNASGLAGTASLTTGGYPNLAFTPSTNGLYALWFDPNSLAYAVQLQWRTDDIGTVGAIGRAAYDNRGTFTVLGSGWDIQSTADAFRYVYQPQSGDGEMRARVTNLQNTDPWAKAGVMLRESALAGAPYAAVFLTPANGITFQWRGANGGTTSTATAGGLSAPRWVRLLRSANLCKAYYSADGQSWTQLGATQTIPMNANAALGLAVSSHSDGTLTTSTFDNVVIGPLNTPPSLGAIPAQTILAGRTLWVTNAATDADIPSQTLTFSLLNPPAGAAIDAGTGVLAWRPTIAQSPATQSVTVVVADNGIPSMSATQNFLVRVARPTWPSLSSEMATNGRFGFRIDGDAGPDYTIMGSSNLISWSALVVSNSPPLPFFWTDSKTNASRQFYRVLLGP